MTERNVIGVKSSLHYYHDRNPVVMEALVGKTFKVLSATHDRIELQECPTDPPEGKPK